MNFSAQKQEQGHYCAQPKNIIQLMRISLLVIVLLSASFQLLFAGGLRAQDMSVEKVTVSLNHQELTSAFKQIEQQTTLRFFYRKAEVSKLNELSLSPARRTIEQTLFELLNNTGFTFRQIDQNILIERKVNSQNTKIRISGKVSAMDDKKRLPFANVELLRSADLQLVGQAVTDTSGRFEISTQDNSPHLIRVSLMGYHIYRSLVAESADITLPEILLEPDLKVLKEVVITSHSPLVKQEVDRLVYNVQADPDNKTSSALDMLAKVPLISVDADGNIKLKGSSSFKVLIDGHTSSLVVNDPKEIFRVMPASSIASIEVITIPPAKYDSEGLAGIINVVTVRKKLDGYNGNVSFQYKAPNGPRSSANLTLKSGKFAMSVLGGYNINNTPQTTFSIHRENISPMKSVIDQAGTAHTDNHQGILYSQYSYEIDSLNQIAAIINYSAGSNHRIGGILTQQTGGTNDSYQIDNDGHASQHGYDLGLDYQMGFRRKKTQLLSLSYRYSNNDYHQDNELAVSRQINTNLTDYDQRNQSGTREHTVQLDYTQPIKRVTMETGIKTIFRDNFSDYTSTLPNNSNSFDYQQNIYAAYNSYQFNLHSWTVKAGARLEITALNADFSSGGILHIPDYNRLVPAIALQKKLTPDASINFGYTERVSRPNIIQLNPYIDHQDPLSISYGNPNLRPELNHTFSINYSAYGNNAFNGGISYSFSNNSIQYISLLGTDGVTNNTYDNLGKNAVLAGYISFNYAFSQRVSLNVNGEIRRVHLTGMVGGLNYERNAIGGNSIVNLNYKLDHDWRTGFLFQYYSPGITLQSTTSPYYYTSFSLAKSLFNKKLNISGSVSNPYLKYLDYKTRYADPNYTQLIHNDIVYRRFNITINYAFGRLRNGSIKKNNKSVKNDDTSTVAPPMPPGN